MILHVITGLGTYAAVCLSSLFLQVGTATTNSLIAVRRKMDKNFEGESEDIPILETSLAYGVYMAVSSNLRYVPSILWEFDESMNIK